MASFCWERHRYAPFVALIAVAATYLAQLDLQRYEHQRLTCDLHL